MEAKEAKRKTSNGGANGAPGPKTHAPYPAEFRAEAVHLVRSGRTSMRQVAKDLGVHEETLRLWVKQVEIDAGRRDGLTTGEREELAQLRRENRLLKEEREILKKAAAFFAKESATR
jgi:transposase